MPQEVPATLQLYLNGKMEQFWLRQDGNGVVFLMTTANAEEAASLLKALPLGDAALFVWGAEDLLGPRAPGRAGAVPLLGRQLPSYDLFMIAVGPLTPLGALIESEQSATA